MAIAPIDLQTLFSQVDKVGKAQAAMKEGQAIQQAIQGAILQRKAEEQVHQVNEAQNSGEGADKIKDKRHGQGEQGGEKGKKREGNSQNAEEVQVSYLRDPNLGKQIDISL